MPLYRCQVVFQGGSDKPEDQFVNVWWFIGTGPTSADAPGIFSRLTSFYTQEPPGSEISIGASMSSYIRTPVQIKVYDMADEEPRVPTIGGFNMPSRAAGFTTVPEEMAVCMSFHTHPPITARRRGRVYLGPLNSTAMTPATAVVPTRVSNNFIEAVRQAGQALMDSSGPNLWWAIHSTVGNLAMEVTGGWIDNEFDTQRRRGVDATSRVRFGTLTFDAGELEAARTELDPVGPAR